MTSTLARKHWRAYIGFILGGALLACTTYVWAEQFVFGKVIFVPEWAKPFPAAWRFPTYVAAVALLPAVVFPRDALGALVAVLAAIAFGSLGAIVGYWEQWEAGKYLFANALLTFAWVAMWHCLPAAIVLVVGRWSVDALMSKRG